MRDGSSWVEPVLSLDKCVLLKDHDAVTPVRLDPAALPSRVKHSTTEPLHSLPFCSVERNHLCNFIKEFMRNNSVKLFKFGPVVQEEMSLKDISYLELLQPPLFGRAEPFVLFW